ncbi:hypothetical protein LCI18_003515 [Fusarium solani-melongenae]|uniref:Uncharacterized protein n=1 Tax=Fusarium solani subsp. cucurbitae TaxID=2747967 RepID=A0ACD3YUG0_FUSSC|nr:hypothetical protein LCI18_003515 [Fusarium solani-melongenae]
MSKQPVRTSTAPDPMPRVFPQAVVANGLVYCSGNISMDETNHLIEGDVKAHTHQIIKNLSEVLKAAGSSLDKIVKINIYLADFGDFDQVNEVYCQYFKAPNLPSRTCVCVKSLPFNTDIEVECTALVGPE